MGRIAAKHARKIVVDHHYSHAWPTGNFASFGVFVEKKIVGVVTFGHPANNRNWEAIPGCKKSRDLCELTRLWIADSAPKMCESMAIGASLRALRSGTKFRVVVSYADPAQGHVGTVYQATNWVFIGQSDPSRELLFSDGTQMHTRAAFDRFGTNSVEKLQVRFPGVRSVKVPGKYKYLYPLDKRMQKALASLSKPYPARPPAGSDIPSRDGVAVQHRPGRLDGNEG